MIVVPDAFLQAIRSILNGQAVEPLRSPFSRQKGYRLRCSSKGRDLQPNGQQYLGGIHLNKIGSLISLKQVFTFKTKHEELNDARPDKLPGDICINRADESITLFTCNDSQAGPRILSVRYPKFL